MSEALPSMIEALALEVAAVRKRGGGTQIDLRGGEQVGQASHGSWLYRFILSEEANLRDDTPVRVTSGQEDVPGIIVSFRDGVLVVAMEKDLGPKIASARLLADESFLLERLRNRLEALESGEAEFQRGTAESVIGRGNQDTADAEPDPAVLSDGSMNEHQVHAIRRSLGSQLTYIWGPPGTGKTTTLARIVEAHYRAGRSVLLVSNTNIAVDTALEKVAERLKGETDFHQGLVIRQGPVVKVELRETFGSQVMLDQIVARLGENLQEEKVALSAEASRLNSDESELERHEKEWQQLESVRETVRRQTQARVDLQSKIQAREREASQHRACAQELQAEVERARSMGAIRRFFSGLNADRLEREAATANRSADSAANAARALAFDLPKLAKEIEGLTHEAQQLEGVTSRHPAPQVVRERLGHLRSRQSQIRERVAAIDRELSELEQQVLSRCRILATTVYRTYLGKESSRPFDTVVVDEASMLMPPLVYYASGLAKHSVTVAGDFRQLPPIVTSSEDLAEEWLRTDVFHLAGIPKWLRQGKQHPNLVPLGIQYRMREPICDLVNRLCYSDHPLRSDPCVNRTPSRLPLSDAPLLFVDTSPFHPWTALRVGTYSRYNLFHALLVRNILLHFAETGFLPADGEPNHAVGAVAPYASQSRLIQALIEDRLGSRAAGIAATVHRFQGNEKSVMLLDLTDSLGVKLGKFLVATRIEEEGARLLNVALSRARHQVILIGNLDYLASKAPAKGFVRRIVDHFQEHGEALDLSRLLPLAERDWIDGLHHTAPFSFDLPEGAAGIFTEGTFYPAFRSDLQRARRSIVILSPFATRAGSARWTDLLRGAIARGVRIRLLTRPPQEFGGGTTDEVYELVHGLRDIGVHVDLRARMHEKMAILDDQVVWHGSLNILSHRDTHESMLRFESAAAVQQLARFLSTPQRRQQDATVSLDAPENPPCPACGRETVWTDGRYGVYFACEDPGCDGKVDSRRRRTGSRTATRKATQGRSQASTRAAPAGGACPRCHGKLQRRTGRYGPFLGCANFPTCRYTANLT